VHFLPKNGQICGFHWTFRSKKYFSFRGLRPLTPDQGLCPWTPLGARPPDPRYRLALRALAMAPLCLILNTPLVRECGLLGQWWRGPRKYRREGICACGWVWGSLMSTFSFIYWYALLVLSVTFSLLIFARTHSLPTATHKCRLHFIKLSDWSLTGQWWTLVVTGSGISALLSDVCSRVMIRPHARLSSGSRHHLSTLKRVSLQWKEEEKFF